MAKSQTAKARVLTDNIALSIKCGQLVEGPAKVIKALADAGVVDDHPDAVEFATAKGAKLVALDDPEAAADVAAALTEPEPVPEPATQPATATEPAAS